MHCHVAFVSKLFGEEQDQLRAEDWQQWIEDGVLPRMDNVMPFDPEIWKAETAGFNGGK